MLNVRFRALQHCCIAQWSDCQTSQKREDQLGGKVALAGNSSEACFRFSTYACALRALVKLRFGSIRLRCHQGPRTKRRQETAVLILSLSRVPALPAAVQWLLLAALSAAFAALLQTAGLPAALFLGPMAGGVVMGVKGAAIRVPRIPYLGAQAIMGVFIASAITLSIVHSFFQDWPIILGVVFSIIAASSALGWAMSRWHVMPGTTSVWGSWPGAAAAMVIMAAEFGADARLVAFMQYFRVACVASVASIVATFWAHGTGLPHPAIDWFPPVRWQAFSQTLLLAGACAYAGRVLRIPSGAMLITLLA